MRRTPGQVRNLAARLNTTSRQEVIDRAKLEQSLFWEGFEEEARQYLSTYPQELEERKRYATTAADRSKEKR